jgi:hypothetical protein
MSALTRGKHLVLFSIVTTLFEVTAHPLFAQWMAT